VNFVLSQFQANSILGEVCAIAIREFFERGLGVKAATIVTHLYHGSGCLVSPLCLWGLLFSIGETKRGTPLGSAASYHM
jgi:hypothetical protein